MADESKKVDGMAEKSKPAPAPAPAPAAPAEIDRSKCVALVMGGQCPNCGYLRHEGNLEPHPVA